MREVVVMVATSYPRFPGDGVGSFMEPIAKGVAARGHEVHLVAPWHPAITRAKVEDGVYFHFFEYAPIRSLNIFGYAEAMQADTRLRGSTWMVAPLAMAAGWFKAWRVATKKRATVMHGHWVVPGGVIAARAAGRRPLVISLHGSDVFVAERNGVARRAALGAFHRAGWVTACSDDLRDRAIAIGADRARTETVPYGVDVARFAPSPTLRSTVRARLGVGDAPLVAAAGRLVAKKGFEYLIDAVRTMASRAPGVRLAIAGDGDLREALAARAAGAPVLLLGRQTQDEVAALLAAADVVAVPSVRDDAGNIDGLPNVALEALATATPVVGTTAGGLAQAIEDGVNGRLVPERDAAALAGAIGDLLANPDRAREIGRRARARVERDYGWARVAERFELAYARGARVDAVSLLSHSRRLLKDVATYGLGDVATSIINVLLIPIYSHILSTEEVGIIALLVGLEAGMKIVLRWGVDSAFMRLYFDCRDDAARQTLASTIWLFLLMLNAPVFAIAIAFAPQIGELLFGVPGYTGTLRIFLVNTFLLTFTFIPFHVYRIEGRTQRFAALTFTRAFGSVLLRLLFIVQLGLGVSGVVIADLLLTFVVFAAMAPTVAALLRPRFDRAVLAEALRFGGPRVPHGIAHQVTATADRWMLRQSGAPLGVIGIYGMGATVGLGMKLFLSAFEYAWAPFYLDTMRRPEAKQIYSRITTYVTAVLALLAAGMAALAHDVVQLMVAPKFWDAHRVVPWIGLGVLFQGFYQLTAIGLNITKRTASLPLATMTAAAIAIGLNLVLLPRVGMIGAAWTYAASYAAMAIVGMTLSQRVYPIAYEWRRLSQLAIAGLLAWTAGRIVAQAPLPLAVRVLITGATVAAVYPLVLWMLRFFRPGEVQMLVRMRDQLTSVARRTSPGEETELGGEIADVPSIVDHTEPDSADPPKSRKVE